MIEIIAIFIILLVMTIMLIDCWKQEEEMKEFYKTHNLKWWDE
jgi:hypothetical protein